MNPFATPTARWLMLMALTLVTVTLSIALRNPYLSSLLALGIAVTKGRLVIEHFMEMAGVTDRISRIVHRIVLAWLVIVAGLIALAYWLGAV